MEVRYLIYTSVNWVIIGSGNGLLPVWCQGIHHRNLLIVMPYGIIELGKYWFLRAPRHYRSDVDIYSSKCNFAGNAEDIYPWYEFENYKFNITATSCRPMSMLVMYVIHDCACKVNTLRPRQNCKQRFEMHPLERKHEFWLIFTGVCS